MVDSGLKVDELLEELRSIESEFVKVICIGSRSVEQQADYVTGIRQFAHIYFSVVVVSSQSIAVELAERVYDYVDMIFVDAEKKIAPKVDCGTGDLVDLGNISGAVWQRLGSKKIKVYKANDIAVEASMDRLNYQFSIISNKTIAVVGIGNIGFKLALKFLESGASVCMWGRNYDETAHKAAILNSIKPKNTLASCIARKDLAQVLIDSDAVCSCVGSGIEIFKEEHFPFLKRQKLILDVGVGNFSSELVASLKQRGVAIERTDVTRCLGAYIFKSLYADPVPAVRSIAHDVVLVSGGYLGAKGDIVVDDVINPRAILGVADGKGHWIFNLSPGAEAKVKKVAEELDIKVITWK